MRLLKVPDVLMTKTTVNAHKFLSIINNPLLLVKWIRLEHDSREERAYRRRSPLQVIVVHERAWIILHDSVETFCTCLSKHSHALHVEDQKAIKIFSYLWDSHLHCARISHWVHVCIRNKIVPAVKVYLICLLWVGNRLPPKHETKTVWNKAKVLILYPLSGVPSCKWKYHPYDLNVSPATFLHRWME